jgi:hypothetical protein
MSWWNYFEQCTSDTNAKSAMEYYCGDLDLQMPLTLALKNRGGKYGAQNLYCHWQVKNVDSSNPLSLNLTNFLNPGESTLVMEIYSSNGQRQYQTFNNQNAYWVISPGVSSLHFHFFTDSAYKYNPFQLSLKDGVSSINTISIIISIAAVVVSCFALSILLIRCSKRLIQRRLERNLQLQQPDIPNNPQINIVNNYVGRTQEEVLKINKEILDKMLITDLKSVKYSEKLNVFEINCTICLEDFNERSDVIVLECKHIFHFDCLKDWLLKNLLHPKCPNCNYNVLFGRDAKELNVRINGEPVEANRVLNLNNRSGLVGNHLPRGQNNNEPNNNYQAINIEINTLMNHPQVINFEIRNRNDLNPGVSANHPNLISNNNEISVLPNENPRTERNNLETE